ncbi:MAG: rhodanese-like domain-containing protein [Bacteroidota bacterium]
MLYTKKNIGVLLLLPVLAFFSFRQQEPWQPTQLMQPAALAEIILHPDTSAPLIICVGPGALIKGSVDAGAAHDKTSFDKLRRILSNENRDREIVIYCGCCPFDHCPNIRPAFSLLTEMKFKHPRLLDLPHNIKTDWINKGYPTSK